MEALFVLAVILLLITLIGHGIWVFLRWIIRQLAGKSAAELRVQSLGLSRCANCNADISSQATFCGYCGAGRPSGIVVELLKDLAATERQLGRFRRAGGITNDVYEEFKSRIQTERIRLSNREAATPATPPPVVPQPAVVRQQPASVTESTNEETAPSVPPSVILSETSTTSSVVIDADSGSAVRTEESVFARDAHVAAAERDWEKTPPPPPSPATEPRRPLAEVLAAFMEQSNIRWGEIIGGLLIIGCSTALVVSLWAQISSIPVLKFLIFTTVTAALFGVGLYTEHRWKLPTTSRGILTIATLLVPLNFLAIAAVSGGAASQGSLVIASELIAPALFLCLVYFAGRVITPKWPHLLAAGVLGSSVGQLLIRHFADAGNSPELLLALGAFPVICYAAAAAWMLWIALADSEIDERETGAIFVTLGALTFAALLPFGLLLYRSGPVAMTMMYLAPLVTLGGVPMLASGTLLWKRVRAPELAASRTAGTSVAIIGTVIVISGMILAWPNPASIVPAALLNFAVLTTLAVLLDLSFAHFLAAVCFSLAYVVMFHVLAGHVPWQNLRIVSLLDVTTSVSSGQSLLVVFLLFVAASAWLVRKGRRKDSVSYLFSACTMAVISLLYLTQYGFNLAGDPHWLWLFYLVYALGALWLARRHVLPVFAWIGSALLLVSLFHALGPWLSRSFPWQTAILLHASVCALIAIIASRYCEFTQRSISRPLNSSALISSFVALLCLLQANQWETTGIQAERVFWIAGIWFALLWLNRDRRLFTVFQIALAGALVLAIKATLQQYEWYAYLPHAFLHPTALQIQGTVLVLLSLGWVGVRFALSDKLQFVESRDIGTSTAGANPATEHWTSAARRLLQLNFAFDRLVIWAVLGAFALLAIYGAFSGVKQELTAGGSATRAWDIVGFPHHEALGLGSWVLLGLLVIAMLANLWERRHADYLLGAVVALVLICPLLAGRWEAQVATASAWRWLATIFLVVVSLPLWFRERLGQTNFSLSLSGEEAGTADQRQAKAYRTWARRTRLLLLWATLPPLLILTAYPALRAIYYMPVHGPASGIFFALGDTLSYSIPLVIVALTLIAYALRERLLGYAFSAGLFFNVTVTMVYLLSVVSVHGDMDRVVLVRVIQLNTIVSALYAILWLSVREGWRTKLSFQSARLAGRLFKIQLGILIVGLTLVLIPASVHLIVRPGLAGAGTAAVGGVYGWLAFVLTSVAWAWFIKSYEKAVSPDTVCGLLVGLSCLVAFSATTWVSSGWGNYHVFMFSLAGVASLMCVLRSMPSLLETHPGWKNLGPIGTPKLAAEWEWNATLFATLVGAMVVVLALRVAPEDPGGAWWSITALVMMSALAAALNWQTRRQEYLFAAGLLFNGATSIWWWKFAPEKFSTDLDFICVNIAAGCAASILWLWLQLRARRQTSGSSTKITDISFHHLAALASLSLMIVVLLISFTDGASGLYRDAQFSFVLGWLALASLTALMFACLWDQAAKYAGAGLFLTGLLAAAIALKQAQLSPRHLGWAALMVMSIYSVIAGSLWRQRRTLISWASQLKIPQRLDPDAKGLRWLQIFTAILVVFVISLTYWVDLRFSEWTLRLTAASAVIVQALALTLVAQETSRQSWRKAAFAVFVLGAVFFGWAWLVPGVTGTWLNRAVILMVEMFAIVALFGLELEKLLAREPDWAKAIRACAPWLTGVGIVALIFVLCTEVFYQIQFGAVRINPLALVTIGLTLAGAAVICILFALSPKHDPLNLPEERRRNYVYVAEVMLALFFMHIRLTMPWLFTGFFERYWPVVVVAIAYVGVAASELLRRRGVLVLAHPIERTGVFLPLLPVLGFWLTNPEVDYSVLLFIVGGLYGLVSILRRSFVFGILAVLAGNGGLWYLWHRTSEYGFLQHPQLWLIPVAGSVLIAAYLNRADFSEEQMVGIRYLALITIYASSTADIFINGVARSPWLPLILAALSLAGVFGGIVLRIRAFLLLGTVFLLLAITTMIYFASENFGWTWLWYVAGIVTGAMIIFTFALFEKKRDEMLRVVEGLKEWDR
jgi:hypothetical protein